jgi:hypothetical protein
VIIPIATQCISMFVNGKANHELMNLVTDDQRIYGFKLV